MEPNKIINFKLYKAVCFDEIGQPQGGYVFQRCINAPSSQVAINKCRAMGMIKEPYLIENMETGEKTSF